LESIIAAMTNNFLLGIVQAASSYSKFGKSPRERAKFTLELLKQLPPASRRMNRKAMRDLGNYLQEIEVLDRLDKSSKAL
jgi:uncharacterized membrane protein